MLSLSLFVLLAMFIYGVFEVGTVQAFMLLLFVVTVFLFSFYHFDSDIYNAAFSTRGFNVEECNRLCSDNNRCIPPCQRMPPPPSYADACIKK